MELAAFLLAEQRASLLRAEHKVNDDIGKGLGHWSDALTGLMMFVRLTWASARGARFSPGYNIRGFQPRVDAREFARESKQAAERLEDASGRLWVHLPKSPFISDKLYRLHRESRDVSALSLHVDRVK